MENLEIYCRKQIFENRGKWFETELDETDIENFFTSPIKTFKSGKNYIVRINVPTLLNNCNLKIYNENEEELGIDKIKENDNVVSVLEFQGIKCSPRNFQIDIEIKQMMILNAVSMFETCVFTPNKSVYQKNSVPANFVEDYSNTETTESEVVVSSHNDSESTNVETPLYLEETYNIPLTQDNNSSISSVVNDTPNMVLLPSDKSSHLSSYSMQKDVNEEMTNQTNTHDMEEIDFDLDELPPESAIQLKQRDNVYYDMYKEAKRKAKMARDLAISSFLEAKNIKQTYMLDDIEDSDSDFDETDLDMF
jgi:hypothetical protein